MVKRALALLSVAFISACSGSTPSSGTNPPTNITPIEGSRAGAYIGDFGSGNGVYVLGDNNAISGMALLADGTAYSLFGNLGGESTFTGSLSPYYHPASTPANDGGYGPGEGVLESQAPLQPPSAFNLNIVDGQTIESLSGAQVNLTAATAGELSAATPAAVAGTWAGRHRFCSAPTDCSVLATEVTFANNEFTGRTFVITSAGVDTFIRPIVGNLTEVNGVSTLTFTWNENTYNGSIAFLPGTTNQLVFLGETANTDAGNRTIASLLTQ